MPDDPDSPGNIPDLRTVATGLLAALPSSSTFSLSAVRSSATASRARLNNRRIGPALTGGL